MVGKVDEELFIAHGTDTLTITGTVSPSRLGAASGDEVLIEVLELRQGDRSVSCNRKFPVIDPAVDLAWSMVVSASHFVSGPADRSDAQASLHRHNGGGHGQPQDWQQPDPAIVITKL